MKLHFSFKSSKSLAENKIKKEIEQLLSKENFEDNFHEGRKQQNE